MFTCVNSSSLSIFLYFGCGGAIISVCSFSLDGGHSLMYCLSIFRNMNSRFSNLGSTDWGFGIYHNTIYHNISMTCSQLIDKFKAYVSNCVAWWLRPGLSFFLFSFLFFLTSKLFQNKNKPHLYTETWKWKSPNLVLPLSGLFSA